jgi:hypothetical protein
LPALPIDRRRLVAAVEDALRARARRRTVLRRALGSSACVAAAAAVIVVAAGPRREARDVTTASPLPLRALTVLGEAPAGGQVIAPDGSAQRATRGMIIGAGLRLLAPSSDQVRVGTADGTQLTLEPRADLAVVEAGHTQRFALRAGVINLHVARLFASERFVIGTPDAEIEVRGSAFRVALVPSEPECGGGTVTRVSVSEGIATVRSNGRELSVHPGERWPAACATTPAEDRTTPGPARVQRHPKRAAAIAGVSAAPAIPAQPPPIRTSSLAIENDLFGEAVRARNSGRLADAARAFGRLADEHPKSPLVESAMAQRMRILAALDPVAAARAASEYLARFPAGVAHPEAERLAARTAP